MSNVNEPREGSGWRLCCEKSSAASRGALNGDSKARDQSRRLSERNNVRCIVLVPAAGSGVPFFLLALRPWPKPLKCPERPRCRERRGRNFRRGDEVPPQAVEGFMVAPALAHQWIAQLFGPVLAPS